MRPSKEALGGARRFMVRALGALGQINPQRLHFISNQTLSAMGCASMCGCMRGAGSVSCACPASLISPLVWLLRASHLELQKMFLRSLFLQVVLGVVAVKILYSISLFMQPSVCQGARQEG